MMRVSSVKAHPRQQGFTLLELIVSMTLTALLLGMLSAGMYSVVNDWTRQTDGLDQAIDKSLVLLQIERAMEAARTVTSTTRKCRASCISRAPVMKSALYPPSRRNAAAGSRPGTLFQAGSTGCN